MASPALGALLFLLLLPGRGAATGPEGELCPQEGALRCPQLRDGADAKLCCGGCRPPSCCPAGEAQPEGQRCPREAPATLPAIQEMLQNPRDWQPVLAFFIILIVLLMLWMIVCYCKGRCWRWGTYYLHPNAPNSGNQDLIPLAPHPLPEEFLGPPPPYNAEPPGPPAYGADPPGFMAAPPPYDDELPPYSAEDLQDNWDPPLLTLSPSLGNEGSGGEAAVGPLVHRNVSGHSSTSTLEADAVVDS